MTVDLQDQVISPNLFMLGNWEPFESQLMARVLKPGMTFLDIGAHVGYYSLLAARAVGPQGRVLAIEPSPDNFRLLRANIWLNGQEAVIHPVFAAAAAAVGDVDLFLSTFNTGDHRIYQTAPDDDALFNDGASRRAVRVPVITVDRFLADQGIARVDVVKMDVQGAELEALKGMKQTLSSNPDLLLFMEFWPYGLKRFGADPRALEQLLTEELGLAFLHIHHQEKRLVSLATGAPAWEPQADNPDYHIDIIGFRGKHPFSENVA